MVDGYYTAVAKLLRQHGFRYLANAKGSHERWWTALAEPLLCRVI